METAVTASIGDYVRKIDQMEAMLEEIKRALLYFDKELQESIEKGETDIKEGRVTVCKTKEDLDRFFTSV